MLILKIISVKIIAQTLKITIKTQKIVKHHKNKKKSMTQIWNKSTFLPLID
jgi:hypothetical protein